MYSLIAFLITLAEVLIIVGSYMMQSGNIFFNLLVYGSPFYLIMNLLNERSALLDKNYIFLVLMAFHVIKYFVIFQAQRIDDRNFMRTMAIILEALYLAMSAYYIN